MRKFSDAGYTQTGWLFIGFSKGLREKLGKFRQNWLDPHFLKIVAQIVGIQGPWVKTGWNAPVSPKEASLMVAPYWLLNKSPPPKQISGGMRFLCPVRL